jgi:hypothetical protein
MIGAGWMRSLGLTFASRLARVLESRFALGWRSRRRPVVMVQFLLPVVGFAVPGGSPDGRPRR